MTLTVTLYALGLHVFEECFTVIAPLLVRKIIGVPDQIPCNFSFVVLSFEFSPWYLFIYFKKTNRLIVAFNLVLQ